MGTRKRKSKNSQSFFLKILSLGLILGGGVWIGQKYFSSKPVSSPQRSSTSLQPTRTPRSIQEIQPTPALKPSPSPTPTVLPATPAPKIESVSAVLPQDAWGDDYLKVQAGFKGSTPQEFLISFGRAPSGADPEKIRDPAKLRPYLVLVKKEKEGFIKKAEFDFPIMPNEASLQKSQLAGIPRITPKSFVDLDQDGAPELIVMLDTHTSWPEAAAFLKYEKGELKWIKTKQGAEEKLALWPTGSNASESREMIPKGLNGPQPEIHEKIGKIDPNHPEKGLVWKTRIWVYKKGVLQLKSKL